MLTPTLGKPLDTSPIAWLRTPTVTQWLRTPATQLLSIAAQARQLGVAHGSLHAYLRDELRLRGTPRPVPVHCKAAAGEVRVWESRGRPIAQVKVDGKWKRAGRHFWEQAYGAVPAGYKVIHRDSDRSHYALNNLQLVPTAEAVVSGPSGGRDLSDRYVATTLVDRRLATTQAARQAQARLFQAHPSLINLKRAQLLLQRALRTTPSRHA